MLPETKFPTDDPLDNPQLTQVWDGVSEDLKEALGTSTFDRWFGESRLIKVDENEAVISSPGSMYAIWIEENFKDILKFNLDKYLRDLKRFSFDCSASGETGDKSKSATEEVVSAAAESLDPPIRKKRKGKKRPLTPEEIEEKGREAGLNETYRFENFVVGENSKLANAASLSVVDSPGTYQPLFFHSNSGLGKTHLLHAIGWAFLEKRCHATVIYVGAEKFANEYIDAIRNSGEVAFRKKYREVDLLLIDDVQFLGGKSGFQREFYHTFNSIMDRRNQIVIASDCIATEIAQLEERLVSRLQWGMTVQIHPPSEETREAILRSKRDRWNLVVNDRIISKIVDCVPGNVRQLEGALIRAAMVSSMAEGELHEDGVEEILADMVDARPDRPLGLEDIKTTVADYFDVEVKDLEGKRRMARITEARQVAMFLCRELTDHSLKEIAMSFAKDHATVVYAVKTTKSKCEKSESLKNSVEMLRRRIRRERSHPVSRSTRTELSGSDQPDSSRVPPTFLG